MNQLLAVLISLVSWVKFVSLDQAARSILYSKIHHLPSSRQVFLIQWRLRVTSRVLMLLHNEAQIEKVKMRIVRILQNLNHVQHPQDTTEVHS